MEPLCTLLLGKDSDNWIMVPRKRIHYNYQLTLSRVAVLYVDGGREETGVTTPEIVMVPLNTGFEQ
jgi:hypothetical protein